MTIVHGRVLGEVLCALVGEDPDRVRSITVHADVRDAAWVELERYVEAPLVTDIDPTRRRYYLVDMPTEERSG